MAPAPVVLLLPAFNEAPTVSTVVARAPSTVAGHPVEVIVVDDGSDDATADVALRSGAHVVRHDCNRGLGAAVRSGLDAALARSPIAIAFCDADGEYRPEELERLVEPIVADRADYVVGSRFAGRIDSMLWHRRIGNAALTTILRRLVRLPITDGQSGYRALSAEAAASAEIAHDYNYAQVLTIELVASGFRYLEVPITYSRRRSGRSFVRPVSYLRHVGPTVWRIHRHPRAAASRSNRAVRGASG